ncbi:MAG TPA: restriction endonuclease subunit S [Sphingobacteriaceae bacterium]
MVATGLKKTEIGLIPENWECVIFSDEIKLKHGFQFLEHHFSRTGVPVIKIGNLLNSAGIDKSKFTYVSVQTAEAFRSVKLFQGDVLMALTGATLGKVSKIDFDIECLQNYRVGKFLAKERVEINFVYHVLQSFLVQKTVKELVNSGAQPNLGKADFDKIHIPLPPLPEQTASAEALSDADAWIANLEQLIAKKRLIKQGAMQQLLSPKDDWEVRKLGECSFITKLAGFEYSLHFNSYKDEGEIVVIRGTNITRNKLDLSDIKTIPIKTSNYLLRSKLYKNDLVFAYVGTIGPIYLVEENDRFHLGPNTAKITVNVNLNSMFLYHYFTSSYIKNEIIEHTSIGAQPSLSMSKIRSFKLSFPDLEEQTRIATILSDMDSEKESLEKQLAKARQIKQGMMQELLTGRVRLV